MASKNAGVHCRTQAGGHLVQRGVAGKLVAGLDELLQRHVDQVGRVVLRLGGGGDGVLADLAGGLGVVGRPHLLSRIIAR